MTTRTSFDDVNNLVDPLMLYNFDLIFPTIPGGGNSRGMTVKCMSATLPGMQIDQVTVPLHGVEVNYGGRQIYTKTFTATFLETRDVTTRKAMREWMRFCRNNDTNKGNYKAQYAVDASMILYDDIPNVIQTSKIMGCFPISVDDLQLDGGQSAYAQYNITFSYDRVEDQ